MNMLKTTLLMALLTVLLVLIGGAIGGRGGMTTAFLLAGGMNFFSYWFSDKIVLLARALQKLELGSRQIPMHANAATAHMFIVNPLTGGGMMSLFSTHPPIPERVQRLEYISRTHDY